MELSEKIKKNLKLNGNVLLTCSGNELNNIGIDLSSFDNFKSSDYESNYTLIIDLYEDDAYIEVISDNKIIYDDIVYRTEACTLSYIIFGPRREI